MHKNMEGLHILRELLSMKHRTQLMILETFLEEQQLTVQQLEVKTGVTKQTIIKQIRELEELFSLNLKKQKGTIYLQNKQMINRTEIYHYFYHHSIQLQLISFIFLQPFASTTEIIQTLKISKTKFQNVKKQVVSILKQYGILLTESPFCFMGDFNKMRQFFHLFFLEKYYTIEEYISQKEQSIIEQILQDFICSIHHSMFQVQQFSSYIWVTIKLSMHVRNASTFLLGSSTVNSQIVIDYATFKDVFKLPYPGLVEMKISNLCATLTKSHLSSEQRIKKQAFVTLVADLYELFGEPKEKLDEKMLATITTALVQYSGITYLLNDEKRHFVFEFFRQYGNFSEHISNILLEKLSTFKKKIDDEFLFYELIYLLLIHDQYLLKLIRKKQHKKKVGVFFTYEKEHSQLLLTILENKFNEYATFKILDFHLLLMIDKKLALFDSCISNIPISNQTNCILLDSYPTFENMLELEKFFQKSRSQSLLTKLESPLA